MTRAGRFVRPVSYCRVLHECGCGQRETSAWFRWLRATRGPASHEASDELALFAHLDHRAQAARANVHSLHSAIDLQTAMLHVHQEAAVSAARRVADPVAILRRAPTNVAATGHVYSPLINARYGVVNAPIKCA